MWRTSLRQVISPGELLEHHLWRQQYHPKPGGEHLSMPWELFVRYAGSTEVHVKTLSPSRQGSLAPASDYYGNY